MKKYLVLVILFLGVVSALHAGTYYVLDSVVIKNANDQVTQKQVFAYNSYHKMVNASTYTLQDGQLKLYSVSNYEYDVYGNYSMQETYNYSQDTVLSGSRLTYEYSNDRIQWQKSYIYSQGEWELHQVTDYVYNEDGNRIKQYEYYKYSDVPFEVICANSDMENKVLICSSTTVAFTPKMLFDSSEDGTEKMESGDDIVVSS